MPPQNIFSKLHLAHYCIIISSLFLTLFASYYSFNQLKARQQAKFDREADRAVRLVVERMEKYEDALASAAAYFQNRQRPTHSDWRRYAEDLKLDIKYPGINGIGFVKALKAEEVPSYLRMTQRDRPHFKIYPPHSRDVSFPIVYIEPEGPNAQAVGLDLAWEENRYTAATKARDTGTPQITGPIVLVQDSDKTPGFLFYLPMYADEQRREIEGYIYAPFVVKNLMRGVLSKQNRHVDIRITNQGSELYEEHRESESRYDPNPLFTKQIPISIYGQTWEFLIQSDMEFRRIEGSSQPLWILAIGLIIDLLVAYLLFSTSRLSSKLKTTAERVTENLNRKTEELRINEQRLNLAFEGTADGIWDWDIEKGTVIYSARFKELLGCDDHTMGNSYQEFWSRLHPDDTASVQKAIDAHLQGQQPYDIQYRLRTESGEYRWFRTRGKALWDEQGKPVRMAGSLSDIHLEKQAISRLESALNDLSKKNEELEQFTYIASHDLRSPLVNIMGFSEELAKDCDTVRQVLLMPETVTPSEIHAIQPILERDIPEALRYIGESIARMDMYSHSILDLCRMGQRQIHRELVNVESLVRSVVEGNMHQIRQHGINVRIDPLPAVRADKMALVQIFGNLIDNCIKYSQQEHRNSIVISGSLEGSVAVFSVSDTGRGIPKSGLKRIFDVFQRGSHEHIKGNGMGLTFVKALVEKHNGIVFCDSEEGEGTTITFTLEEASSDHAAHSL